VRNWTRYNHSRCRSARLTRPLISGPDTTRQNFCRSHVDGAVSAKGVSGGDEHTVAAGRRDKRRCVSIAERMQGCTKPRCRRAPTISACSGGSANWRLRSGRRLTDQILSDECSYRRPHSSRETEGLRTPRWRKADSNSWSRFDKTPPRLATGFRADAGVRRGAPARRRAVTILATRTQRAERDRGADRRGTLGRGAWSPDTALRSQAPIPRYNGDLGSLRGGRS
jgi:hypothetical protein